MSIPFFGMEVGQDGPAVAIVAIGGDVDPFPKTHLRAGDMIYILGRVEQALICDKCTHEHGRYFIQGTFSTQARAEKECLDESYFVGPLVMDVCLPHDPMEWPGLYWPRKKPEQEHGNDTGSDASITQSPEHSAE
jgi:hypothetical protein